jgi:NAD(P)-dependent dehydrogenase (short-subunit alcohol dehydrogenase family)
MKIAIITGVSSGIGLEVAKRLLTMDWKVYGLSRRDPGIQNDAFVWIECDLAQADAIYKSLQSVIEPSIDLLVSNAGVAFEEPATAANKDSYEKMFTVNVLAPILVVNALRSKLAKAVIVTVSSVSDRLIDKDFALYCSSKAANTRYFESLADELKDAKVYGLLPDYVDTPMLRELQDGRDFDWDGTIKVSDMANFTVELALGKHYLESGSNIIVVTNSLIDDLKNQEKLYGFNADTQELKRL